MGDLEERVAVSSLWRFGEFRGEGLNLALLRTVKTAIHEVAHAFSMAHCVEYACCLNGSNNQEEGDLQPLELCPSCLEKLAWNIGFDPLDHLFRMQKFCIRWAFQESGERFEELIAACGEADIFDGQADLVISAHGDNNFSRAWIERRGEYLYGFLDNIVGVKAVTDACFLGGLTDARVEITYGEETGMSGALEIAQTVGSDDVVVVVDVTGFATDRDIVIEKCSDQWTYDLIRKAFERAKFTYEIFSDCGDPICQIDETDVYRQITNRCFLLGIPCEGGDYNSHAVRCRERSIGAATQALILLLKQLVSRGRE